MIHINMLSGGRGSWAAGKRVAAKHGAADLVHLFADTKEEDEDTYRFLHEGAVNVGGRLVTVADGRDIWQLFRDERIIGNNRQPACSRALKQRVCRAWVDRNCDPAATTLYVGIGWVEIHRLPAITAAWAPYRVEAPLCEPPYLEAPDIDTWLAREGIRRPRLYDEGFPHGNCAGFCVRAGHAQFKLLLEKRPEVYARHEAKEHEMREFLGKDVSILRDRRGGKTRPLTLREFRERVEAGQTCDLFDWGGCGCFTE